MTNLKTSESKISNYRKVEILKPSAKNIQLFDTAIVTFIVNYYTVKIMWLSECLVQLKNKRIF